jgi:hypothetical protein
LGCCLLCSCRNGDGGKPEPKPGTKPGPESKADLREVATAAELIAAIGSNRTLRLKPGTYVLSDVPDGFTEHVVWSSVFDGKTITVKGVKGLTITGPKDRSAKLVVKPRYAFVLEFKNCAKIRLENLVLGHAPEKGSCVRGVLGLSNAREMTLENCDLYGCGTEGLTLTGVTGFVFAKGRVRDCAYGIMTLKDCRKASFADSEFTGNKRFWGVRVRHCEGVSFKRCRFAKNTVGGPLFGIVSSSPVRLEDTSTDGNTVRGLTDNPKALEVVKAGGR